MRISDWSSDVCSSDLIVLRQRTAPTQLVEYPTKTIAERIEHHHLIWTERPGKLRHPAKRQNRRRAKPRRPASIRCPLLGAMDLSGYQAANRPIACGAFSGKGIRMQQGRVWPFPDIPNLSTRNRLLPSKEPGAIQKQAYRPIAPSTS